MTNTVAGDVAPSDRATLRRVGGSSFIGSMVEWYDFFIYGQASALVLGKLFFPGGDALLGTLASFATFAVGFGARPIGGVIFGHLGDRLGRKSTLLATLFLMGTATVLMGVLPTYAQIGVWAPVLLVALRIAQGVAAGGEWGGGVLMMTEHAAPHRRGFYGSWPQMASSAAAVIAAAVMLVLSQSMSTTALLAWGWRIPFLCSIFMVVIGVFIRLRVPESPEFTRLRQRQLRARQPVVEVMRTQGRPILLVIGMRMAENAGGTLVSTFALSYATHNLGLSAALGLLANMLSSGVQFLLTPAYGALSDHIGRRPVYLLGSGLHVVLAFPFFWLMQTRSVPLILLAFVLGTAVANGALFAAQPALFTELFPSHVRYSGLSLGYQLSAVVGGGLAPFIAAGLLAAAGNQTWPVSLYWVAMAAISFVTALLCRETLPRRGKGG
jgi:MHS family shikimate/dehydroshikimate transporter-like MFS transporter